MDGVVRSYRRIVVEIAASATSVPRPTLVLLRGEDGCGINVQATATASYRFSGVTAKHSGVANKFTAYIRSSFPTATAALSSVFYIVGDASYPPLEKVLSPYAGKGLAEKYDVFNFRLGQLRIIMEQSFGTLFQTGEFCRSQFVLGTPGV